MSKSKARKKTLSLIKRNSHEEDKIVTVEVVMVFYTTYERYQSFSSNDCLNILPPELFSDSKTESKFQNARVKS